LLGDSPLQITNTRGTVRWFAFPDSAHDVRPGLLAMSRFVNRFIGFNRDGDKK
jgi:hypothetical protein